MTLPCDPVLFQHTGCVHQDGIDFSSVTLNWAELEGYLLEGDAASQVLKDGEQGQPRSAEDPGPGQPDGAMFDVGQPPQPSLFPAIFPAVDTCASPRGELWHSF